MDAKLTGVILNKVKSDAGGEYYQYHSYYYYGSESEVKKGKKIKSSNSSKKKLNKPAHKRKIAGSIMLVILLSMGLLGFFWQDLGFAIPDWLASYKQFFLSS